MSDGVFLRLHDAILSAPGVGSSDKVVGSTLAQPYGVVRRFYLFDGTSDRQLLSVSVREDDSGFSCSVASFNDAYVMTGRKFGLELGKLLRYVKQVVGGVVYDDRHGPDAAKRARTQ